MIGAEGMAVVQSVANLTSSIKVLESAARLLAALVVAAIPRSAEIVKLLDGTAAAMISV
jgi:hypothetical protein